MRVRVGTGCTYSENMPKNMNLESDHADHARTWKKDTKCEDFDGICSIRYENSGNTCDMDLEITQTV